MIPIQDFIYKIFLFYLPLLFSLCVHEWAHGWMAQKRGDLTAFYRGRVTLNPAVHIDLIGTLILPLIFIITNSPLFFGWAKPVPVDEGALKEPRKDLFWISFAGPLSNFALALIGALILGLILILKFQGLMLKTSLLQALEVFIFINLLLCFFNLLPLHPLDGAKVLARFLPSHWNTFLESNQHYSIFILIFLVFSGILHFLAQPLLILSNQLINFSQWFALFALKVL